MRTFLQKVRSFSTNQSIGPSFSRPAKVTAPKKSRRPAAYNYRAFKIVPNRRLFPFLSVIFMILAVDFLFKTLSGKPKP